MGGSQRSTEEEQRGHRCTTSLSPTNSRSSARPPFAPWSRSRRPHRDTRPAVVPTHPRRRYRLAPATRHRDRRLRHRRAPPWVPPRRTERHDLASSRARHSTSAAFSPCWRAEGLQKELRPRSKVVSLAEERLQSDVTHPPHLIAKSEFFRRPLPRDAIAALVDAFSHERVTGESRESDFMPWGGAYNRVRPDATAFVHRSELFQLKHAVVVDPPPTTSAAAAAHRWVVRSWMSVHRGDRGGCSGTSPIRTLRIGQTPTTARTVTAWCTSRPDTTPGTSSGSTSRFGRGRAVARVSRVCQRRSSV